MGCASSAPNKRDAQKRVTRVVSTEEVLKANSAQKCWLVIHGKVYDATNYLDTHPGGVDQLLLSAGSDATEAFEAARHSDHAREMLSFMYVGDFAGDLSRAPKRGRYLYRLASSEKVARSCHRLDFHFVPSEDPAKAASEPLVLAPGKHVLVNVDESFGDTAATCRPYTPLSCDAKSLQLLVKAYPGGPVSSRLCKLPIGHIITAYGPSGNFDYAAVRRNYRAVCMIAAGTGVTPMFQILQYDLSCRDEDDALPPQLALLCSSHSSADVLLADELDALQQQAKGRLTVTHTLTHQEEGGDGKTAASPFGSEAKGGCVVLRGRIDEHHVKRAFPPDVIANTVGSPTVAAAAQRVLWLVCGTDEFCDSMTTLIQTRLNLSGDLHRF